MRYGRCASATPAGLSEAPLAVGSGPWAGVQDDQPAPGASKQPALSGCSRMSAGKRLPGSRSAGQRVEACVPGQAPSPVSPAGAAQASHWGCAHRVPSSPPVLSLDRPWPTPGSRHRAVIGSAAGPIFHATERPCRSRVSRIRADLGANHYYHRRHPALPTRSVSPTRSA